jgi:hypothetical protein
MMEKHKFLIALSESERTQFGRVDFADQAEPQKVFSAIWELESEVNNGGFLQYFLNSDGDTVEFSAPALRTIGARACADIVERALRTVSPSLANIQAARAQLTESTGQEVWGRLQEQLGDSARDRLEELDQEFFVYPDDLTALLYAYVASHPETFGPVPVQGDA